MLHSALRLTTWVSIPFWSMVAVVISGVIGRYLYTLVPAMSSKHDLALLDHRRAITELARRLPAGRRPRVSDHGGGARSLRSARGTVGLLSLLVWVLVDDLRSCGSAARIAAGYAASRRGGSARTLARRVDRVVFYERRKELAPRGKALLKSWKKVHIPFSVVLLVTMLVHIALALRLA